MRDDRDKGSVRGLSTRQKVSKRAFDLFVAIPGFIIMIPAIGIAVIIATFDTREWGIFSQERIGRGGEPFRVHKIRSMRTSSTRTTTVTTKNDPRVTDFGALLRRTKIDELPQLWNVIVGEMSLVGPRPDMAGWADELKGDDRIVLSIRPGITGPASIAFRDEEVLLAEADEPDDYNRSVIWPKKVEINKTYVTRWNLLNDISLVWKTVRS